MSPYNKNDQEVGALWIKTSARGEYFSGLVHGEPIVVFRNDKKQPGSKAPDFRILKAKPRETTLDTEPVF